MNYNTEEISKFTKPIESFEDLKLAKRLFYELNDDWGSVWTGQYKEIHLRDNYDDFYEYNVELLTHLSFQYKDEEEMIEKHFKQHRYRYEPK